MFAIQNLSTAARYLFAVVLIWIFPSSTILLMIVPKVVLHRRMVKGVGRNETRGAATGGVRVTGINSATDDVTRSTGVNGDNPSPEVVT